MPVPDPEEVRQLMMRYVLLLSAAEGLAVGMLDNLQRLQQGIRPDSGHERIAHVADTLGMIQAWSRESETLWNTLGIERRRGAAANVEPEKDRRRLRKKKTVTT